MCDEFSKLMGSGFEMSMMGELNLLLGLQLKQTANGTTIFQKKYIHELPKRFHTKDLKPIDTPIETFSKHD